MGHDRFPERFRSRHPPEGPIKTTVKKRVLQSRNIRSPPPVAREAESVRLINSELDLIITTVHQVVQLKESLVFATRDSEDTDFIVADQIVMNPAAPARRSSKRIPWRLWWIWFPDSSIFTVEKRTPSIL